MQIVQSSVTMEGMSKKTMVNISRLERLIERKGWDWRELARQSGLSYDTLWSMKSGRRPNTSSATLQKLAAVLGVSADYLLGQDEKQEVVIGEPLPPAAVRKLTESAERLSELRQEELLRISLTFEKMEAEEAKLDIPDDMMAELMKLTKGLGPHATAKNLIIALGMIFGNQKSGWMVDLGGTRPSSPDNPTEGE